MSNPFIKPNLRSFYLVWDPEHEIPEAVVSGSIQDAKSLAEKLAKENPHRGFWVLQPLAHVAAADVRWHPCGDSSESDHPAV